MPNVVALASSAAVLLPFSFLFAVGSTDDVPVVLRGGASIASRDAEADKDEREEDEAWEVDLESEAADSPASSEALALLILLDGTRLASLIS